MNRSPYLARPTLAWALLTPLIVAGIGLAFLPPFVDAGLGAAITHGFSAVCHQLPDRSLLVDGIPVALCHRCTGILGGLAIGLLVAPFVVTAADRTGHAWFARVPRRHRAGLLMLLALVPATVDWGLGALGLWTNTPVSRSLTGALLGLVAGLLIGRALLSPPRPSTTLSPT